MVEPLHYILEFSWPPYGHSEGGESVEDEQPGETLEFTIAPKERPDRTARFSLEVVTGAEYLKMVRGRPAFAYQMILVDQLRRSDVEQLIRLFVVQHDMLPWDQLLERVGRIARADSEPDSYMYLNSTAS